MANIEETVQFNMNLRRILLVACLDPLCRKEVAETVKEIFTEGKSLKPTTACGYANFGTREKPRWATLFFATDQEKGPGQPGLFYRSKPKTEGEIGERIVLRLRPQKDQAATIGNKLAPEVQQAAAQLAQSQGITVDELLVRLGSTATAVPAAPAGVELPPEVVAQIDTDLAGGNEPDISAE